MSAQTDPFSELTGLMQRLKAACMDPHRHVRSGALAGKIMNQTLSIEEYRLLLLVNYAFHGFIESRLCRILPEPIRDQLAYEQRIKTHFIYYDLRQLGVGMEKQEAFLPYRKRVHQALGSFQISSLPEALGALYVTEGTAIGGQIVKKKLLGIPEICDLSDIRFYGCYGKNLSPLWKSLVQFVNQPLWLAHEDVIIGKAVETFSYYERLVEALSDGFPLMNELPKDPTPEDSDSSRSSTSRSASSTSETPEHIRAAAPHAHTPHLKKQKVMTITLSNHDLQALAAFPGLITADMPNEVDSSTVLLLNLEQVDEFFKVEKGNKVTREWLPDMKQKGVQTIGIVVPKKAMGQVVVKNIFGDVEPEHQFKLVYFNDMQEANKAFGVKTHHIAPPTGQIMQRLKTETKNLHDMVEALAHSDKIMNGLLTSNQYAELIIKNYFLHAQMEKEIEAVLSDEQLSRFNWETRAKMRFLLADLEELNLRPAVEQAFPELHFGINNFHEALGAMYVLEGATLGGAIIRKELSKNPTIAARSSFHYYGCYGSEIGKLWKEFAHLTESSVQSMEQEELVLNTAKRAFGFFCDILKLPTPGI